MRPIVQASNGVRPNPHHVDGHRKPSRTTWTFDRAGESSSPRFRPHGARAKRHEQHFDVEAVSAPSHAREEVMRGS